MKEIDFEEITLRLKVSSRGGGVEIDLTDLGFDGEKMTAYQNYLGGGMLASIQNDCTMPDWRNNDKLTEIADKLARYFHSLTNPDSEWEGMSFEKRQQLPTSAY